MSLYEYVYIQFDSIQLYSYSVTIETVSRVSTETQNLTLQPFTGAGRNPEQDQAPGGTFLQVDGWVKEDEKEGDRKRKGKTLDYC